MKLTYEEQQADNARRGIKKHKDVFDAWLNGATIEFRTNDKDKWVVIRNPKFVYNNQYRVKQKPREYWVVVLWGVSDEDVIHTYSTEDLAHKEAEGYQCAEVIHVQEVIPD